MDGRIFFGFLDFGKFEVQRIKKDLRGRMESPEKEAGLSETLIEQGEYGRLDDWNHDSSKSNFNFSFQVIGSKWNKILQTLETFFECESCGVTVCEEVYYGVIQFICCVYILPVVPEQLHHAGFNISLTMSNEIFQCDLSRVADLTQNTRNIQENKIIVSRILQITI